MTHGLVDHAAIPSIQAIESTLHRCEEDGIEAAVLLLQTQHLRAEHRGQCQGRHGRYREDYTHHPTQLLEHHTHHATGQCHGEEHGNHRQRRGYNGDGHLIGSVDSCLLGVRATLDMCSHVLQYHDGVVHHHTDSDRETGERNHVERTVGDCQVDERGNQRDGDGDGDNEGGTPATEEEEHHKHYEEQGVEHRLGKSADGVLDILRGVGYEANLHVRGEVFLQLGKHLEHLVGNLHGVGSRLLLHYDGSTAHSVGEGHLSALLDGIYHLGYIAQIDVAATHRGYDDVLHLLGIVELTLYAEREGLVTDVERAARDVQVLSRDNLADGLDAEVVGLQLHRVAVDVYLTLCSTTDRHRTHTGDTCQGVGHVVVEDFVESVGRLVGLHRKDHDRHHVGVELQDDGRAHGIGQRRGYHIQFVAHIVGEVVDVVSVFKLECDERHILR